MSAVVASQVLSSPPGILLLIWLHGFKGGDDTFEDFPDRLTFLLSETWPQTTCTSIVYPAYDTRGSLSKASEVFLDWLTVKTTEHQTSLATETRNKGKHKEREQAYVILLGHSMGGLVIADATLKLIRERNSQANLQDSIIWPGIIGLIGFDTPYYGLNPSFFTNAANEYLAHAKTAQQVISNLGMALGIGAFDQGSSNPPRQKKDQSTSDSVKNDPTKKPATPQNAAANNWIKLGLAAAGAAGLAAAAGTTYWQKDKISENVGWAASHLDYVKDLFDMDKLNQRMIDLMEIKPVVDFHCFYTEIPKGDGHSNNLHFIKLPTANSEPLGIASSFSANQNTKASNEITAHTTMFNRNSNSGYWDLGKQSARLISNWLQEAHQRRVDLRGDENQNIIAQSSKFTQDAENRDQLAKEAKINLQDQVGDQMSRDEL